MSNLEKLVIKRVQILSEIKKLKEDSSNGLCKRISGEDARNDSTILKSISNKPLNYKTCIELVYDECRELNNNTCDDGYSYDEVFENTDDEPCDHCKKIRANKKERMKLRRHFGQVNAAITRIGKRLLQENQ